VPGLRATPLLSNGSTDLSHTASGQKRRRWKTSIGERIFFQKAWTSIKRLSFVKIHLLCPFPIFLETGGRSSYPQGRIQQISPDLSPHPIRLSENKFGCRTALSARDYQLVEQLVLQSVNSGSSPAAANVFGPSKWHSR
jgi:hypothetical protein